MGIELATDLILEVIGNGRPEEISRARTALNSQSKPSDPGQPGEFAQVVESARKRTTTPSLMASPALTVLPASSSAPGIPKEKDGAEALEAFVLQGLIEAILPKDSQMLFGSGTAGRMWRSMLAEHVAAQVSNSVDLNLLGDDHAKPKDRRDV